MGNLKIINKDTSNTVWTSFKKTKYAGFKLRIAYLKTKASGCHPFQELCIIESSMAWVTVWDCAQRHSQPLASHTEGPGAILFRPCSHQQSLDISTNQT